MHWLLAEVLTPHQPGINTDTARKISDKWLARYEPFDLRIVFQQVCPLRSRGTFFHIIHALVCYLVYIDQNKFGECLQVKPAKALIRKSDLERSTTL